MHCTSVLTLILLLFGLVHSFKWDIVVGGEYGLEFYYEGNLVRKQNPYVGKVISVAADPVEDRVFFADSSIHMTIFSFNLTSMKREPLVTRYSRDYFPKIVYDPVTKALFWMEGLHIYTHSLKPNDYAHSLKPGNYSTHNYFNKTRFYRPNGTVLITSDDLCSDIAVDSCGGYIYWSTNEGIERARLDGTGREVILNSSVHDRRSLAIDQATQRIYWTEMKEFLSQSTIETADLNGKNRETLHYVDQDVSLVYNIVQEMRAPHSLTISRDYVYWQNFYHSDIWQLPKPNSYINVSYKAKKINTVPCKDSWYWQRIAANYKIQDQIHGVSCNALTSLIANNSNSEPVSQSDQSESVCKNYCFQGDCSVSDEIKPICSCKTGYSGERCEVNACQDYCLNGGVCALKENKRVCHCSADHEGDRCEVSTFLLKSIQAVSLLKDMLNTDLTAFTLGKGVEKCDSNVV
ncbi:hypothetical protein PYW07_016902 [Mythimna separata]|uniref:Protein cueball n=1 Tax=Mythimna separata TaxID=271217 RepID=A0AAD7YWX5_MYTSE|nr:hypothetical protein PYW07_016902 [Mythimna separata]